MSPTKKRQIFKRAAELVFEQRIKVIPSISTREPWCCCFAIVQAHLAISPASMAEVFLTDDFCALFNPPVNKPEDRAYWFGFKTDDETQSERALALLFMAETLRADAAR